MTPSIDPTDALEKRLAALPRGYSIDELLGMDFPAPTWIVPDLLTTGLTILAGAPKLGKSWLALALVSAVGSGGAVLGKYHVEQRGTLYLSLEDTPRRLQARLRRVGARIGAHTALFPSWRSGDEGIADLDAYLTASATTKLVIIDTLARFRGTPKGDDRYAADYLAAASIKAVADKHEAAVVLIHHTRKMESADIMDTVSGTNGINGAADSTWILNRARGEADAKLFITGRDVEEQDLAMRFDPAVGSWAIMGDAHEYAQTQERRDIIRVLSDGKSRKLADIAEALSRTPQAVSNRIRDLEQEGLVRSPKYGYWVYISRESRETVKVDGTLGLESIDHD